MSDLISKNEVIDLLYKTFDEYRISTDKTSTLDGFGSDVFKRVREMQTSYDIDKVVEELKQRSKEYNSGVRLHGKPEEMLTDDAIEIVKQGGVADDVCEWKFTREIMDNAEFKVGCNPNALKRGIFPNNFSYCNFKYCPYCSKKIKVVE